jgi:hypothetical protein
MVTIPWENGWAAQAGSVPSSSRTSAKPRDIRCTTTELAMTCFLPDESAPFQAFSSYGKHREIKHFTVKLQFQKDV